jgi:hypothetical protein
LIPAEHRVDRFLKFLAVCLVDAAGVYPKIFQTIALSLLSAKEDLLIALLDFRINFLYIAIVPKILKGCLLPASGVRQDRIRGDLVPDQVIGPFEPPLASSV